MFFDAMSITVAALSAITATFVFITKIFTNKKEKLHDINSGNQIEITYKDTTLAFNATDEEINRIIETINANRVNDAAETIDA